MPEDLCVTPSTTAIEILHHVGGRIVGAFQGQSMIGLARPSHGETVCGSAVSQPDHPAKAHDDGVSWPIPACGEDAVAVDG